MDKKIEKILKIWHEHFSDKSHQYSEFESSDIEYFVGCLLYNHFAFIKALETMKTIDLSYDFISECGDEYDEIIKIIKSIELGDENKKIEFLQNYIKESKLKYNDNELYLLNRLGTHIDGIADRYKSDKKVEKVNFKLPIKSSNPLLR